VRRRTSQGTMSLYSDIHYAFTAKDIANELGTLASRDDGDPQCRFLFASAFCFNADFARVICGVSSMFRFGLSVRSNHLVSPECTTFCVVEIGGTGYMVSFIKEWTTFQIVMKRKIRQLKFGSGTFVA
jgi:hypothetical protein